MSIVTRIRIPLTVLMVVMLLGGTAWGAVPLPSADWTIAGVATQAAVNEDSVALDGKLVAWEDGGRVRVKNLATGEVRFVPYVAGAQDDPDVSGDRVVYSDTRDGDFDIWMYDWSDNDDTEVRDTPSAEMYPRIDGNIVAWWDTTSEGSVWTRNYDQGGWTARQDSANWSLWDIDNGRLAVADPGSTSVYWRYLDPLGDWVHHSAPEVVQSLEMHGSRIVIGTSSGDDDDVRCVDTASGAVANVAVDAAVDEQNPSVFHYTAAWHEAGTGDFDIGYTWIGNFLLSTPNFGDATQADRFPSLFAHRTAYQRDDGADSDVMLATSDYKLAARSSGANRYSTAAAVSRAYFSKAKNVILCNGLKFPDALSAAPLARALEGPLLLTAPATLSPETLTEITRLAPTKIYVIGGEDVVSKAIYNQLDATYDMQRIAGADRYATSASIARKLESIYGPAEVTRAFFARGDQFPDALAVGPVAANAHGPVMLVQPTAVPASIASAINDLDITHGFVIGGSDVVSEGVRNTIKTLEIANGGIGIVERWAGDNRYATATDVVENGLDWQWIDLDTVGFAIGTDFPDALGGGAALGAYGSCLLLTGGTSLSAETGAFLDAHRYEIGRTDAFGGADVLTDVAYNAIKAKIK